MKTNKLNLSKLLSLLLLGMVVAFSSCRGEEEEIIESTGTQVTSPVKTASVKGFFLLNEANMGSNKSSLDYFDYESGMFHLNIYPERNPAIAHELGDVGNDIQIYGNKIYAVINCSHLIEVMDVNTARHIATISVPNCRYITFDKGNAYVSSYAGPVQINPNARLGYVARIDTATLTVKDTCVVGYQPEEMVIRNNKLYVANSGGYRVPEYDNTISVIDLNTFKQTNKIEVAINLHRMEKDNYGNIYVSSRGDYKNVKSNTYIIDLNDNVTYSLGLSAGNMALSGDSLYIYSSEWSHITQNNTVTYAIVNTKTQSVVSRNFITDGTDQKIAVPYGLAINPETKEIYVTDAKDYVTPGTLYCFTPDGKKKWQVTTGDIPAHIVFTKKKLKGL